MNDPKLQMIDDPEERKKLRAIVTEMRQLMVKHDVFGYVQIVGKTNMEWGIEMSPSWSCITLENDDGKQEFRVRFKAAVKTGGPEERARATLSIGALIGMADIAQSNAEQFLKLASHFGADLNVSHTTQKLEEE